MPEPFGAGYFLIPREVVRMDVPDHRQVVTRGPQILAQGQHRDTVFQQIVHGLEQLVLRFSQAQHDTALGRHFPVYAVQRHFQDAQGAAVLGTEAHDGGKAFHRFQIVAENVRAPQPSASGWRRLFHSGLKPGLQ